jgi:hypothetical protein
MAQNPVYQLAVVRDSVHAESSEKEGGDIGQIMKLRRANDNEICPAEQWEYDGQNEEVDVAEIVAPIVFSGIHSLRRRTLLFAKISLGL